jgi:hypothetical protein
MPIRLRQHLPFLGVLALASVLLLPGLGYLPSPAGDEGNWALLARDISRGGEGALEPGWRVVTNLFARLMGASMWLFGETFFAGRLVNVVGVLLGITITYACLFRLGSRRMALAVALVLTLHPWNCFWARTAAVPYALAGAIGCAGPALFVLGLRHTRRTAVAAGILLVSLGAHFSPLSLCAAVACLLYTLPSAHRWVWKSPWTYVAAAVAAVHTVPIFLDAIHLARGGPAAEAPKALTTRFASFAHMVGTGMVGEATLQHATNVSLGVALAIAPALLVLPVVLLPLRRAVRERSMLPAFGPLYFLSSLVLLPLILAPGRAWQLEVVDSDRYLFALLPGFAFCLGDLIAASPLRWERGLAFLTMAWVGLGTARGVRYYLWGGGPDLGSAAMEGGGAYRCWRPSREHEAIVVTLRDAVRRDAGPEGGTVFFADYGFHTMEFANAGTNIVPLDLRKNAVPAQVGGRYYFVIFNPGIFGDREAVAASAAENEWLRGRMLKDFRDPVLIQTLVQPNGSPLMELWRARAAP